jgi:hypothetical protein
LLNQASAKMIVLMEPINNRYGKDRREAVSFANLC